jgi:hypothetical protein
VVNDFIERLDPAGSDVRFHFLHQMIQPSSRSIGFDSLVPLRPQGVMETMQQIPPFLGRKPLNGRLDFLDRAHVDKIRRALESASAEMLLLMENCRG